MLIDATSRRPWAMSAILGGAVFLATGCQKASSPSAPTTVAYTAYLHRETGEVMRVSNADASPVDDTKYAPAMYCPNCQKWHPAPPPAVREQQPLGPVCPVTQQPLQLTDEPAAANSAN